MKKLDKKLGLAIKLLTIIYLVSKVIQIWSG